MFSSREQNKTKQESPASRSKKNPKLEAESVKSPSSSLPDSHKSSEKKPKQDKDTFEDTNDDGKGWLAEDLRQHGYNEEKAQLDAMSTKELENLALA